MQFIYLTLAIILALAVCGESFTFSSRVIRHHNRVSRLYSDKPKTPLVANGKRVEADPGSSMMTACKKLGLRVPTSCKKGDCGTCTVTVAGQKIRACVGKVPPAPKLKSLKEKGLAVSVDN